MDTDDEIDETMANYQNRSIALTIMGDIDGSTRSENGKSAGIVKADGVCWAVFNLRVETESVSIPVSPATSS